MREISQTQYIIFVTIQTFEQKARDYRYIDTI